MLAVLRFLVAAALRRAARALDDEADPIFVGPTVTEVDDHDDEDDEDAEPAEPATLTEAGSAMLPGPKVLAIPDHQRVSQMAVRALEGLPGRRRAGVR